MSDIGWDLQRAYDEGFKDGKRSASQWHRVEEELPPDGEWVLVCNDDWHMLVAKYESEVPQWEYKYTNYDWDVWDDQEQGPVCYWMPIEPPKEDA